MLKRGGGDYAKCVRSKLSFAFCLTARRTVISETDIQILSRTVASFSRLLILPSISGNGFFIGILFCLILTWHPIFRDGDSCLVSSFLAAQLLMLQHG